MNYTEINKSSWDKWSNSKCIWTIPITHEEYVDATNGKGEVFLTPLKAVPHDWYGSLKNKKILGLASGGGQQCPIFVAMGADVTVFDISNSQLNSERIVAERENYKVTLVQGDMTQKFPFKDETFDMIFNPVSNSYVNNLSHVWKECNRVLKKKGILLSGFANPTIYLYKLLNESVTLTYKMPYNPLHDLSKKELEDLSKSDGIQFGHSFMEQIGSQLSAGFSLVDFYEDYHPIDNNVTKYDTVIGEIASILTRHMPIYFATKSKKN